MKRIPPEKIVYAFKILFVSGQRQEKALDLLIHYLRARVKRKKYPIGFGNLLYKTFKSDIGKVQTVFHRSKIIKMISLAIQVSRYAPKNEQIFDVFLLFRGLGKISGSMLADYESLGKFHEGEEILESIIEDIGERKLAKKIHTPLCEALTTYKPENASINDYDEFINLIYDFYKHIMTSTKKNFNRDIKKNKGVLMGEAINVLEKSFGEKGGAKSAFIMAKENLDGGIGAIFSKIIATIQKEETTGYVHLVFSRALGPLDWGKKVFIIKGLMKKIYPFMSNTALSQPPERFVENLEPIVEAYIVSIDKMKNYMKNF